MNIKNKTKIVNISDIKPYPKNAKIHTPAQVEQIKKSIEKYDYIQPICVDKNNVIVIGHGRYEAIKDIDEKLEVVDLSYLKPKEIKKLRILDNKLISGEWDKQALQDEINLIYNGFDDLDRIADELAIDEKELSSLVPELETEGDDDVPEDVKSITKLGDLWELGRHRLLCGDSTKEDDVNRLMDGKKADMVFTDPPYNVSFNGRSGKFEVIKNDDLTEEKFNSFIGKFLNIMISSGVNTYYLCCNWAFYGIMQLKLKPKSCIVWAKNVFGLGRGYRHQHEFILFNGLIDPSIKNESDLWEIKKDTNYKHPTQKPTALSERAIKNSSLKGNIVQEYFLGSGSTLIACEKTKRICYGMELDEHYCDVIVQRYIDFCKKNDIKTNIKHNGKIYNT